MTTPTVGRIVHFYPGFRGTEPDTLLAGPLAAMVSRVEDEQQQRLTLHVFVPTSAVALVLGVLPMPEGLRPGEMLGRCRWCWPPWETR